MTIRSFDRPKSVVFAVLGAFLVFLLMPAGLAAGGKGAAEANGSLSGFIYGRDAKTPVAGAVVKLRNMKDLKELASPATDANGMFTIAGIPEGRYLVGVSAAKEDFNLDYALYVKAGELGKLSVALAAGGGQETGGRTAKKPGFFSSVAGRILIISAVGIGLFFLIVDNETSPIR